MQQFHAIVRRELGAVQLFPTFICRTHVLHACPHERGGAERVQNERINLMTSQEVRLAIFRAYAGFDTLVALFYPKTIAPGSWNWSASQYNAIGGAMTPPRTLRTRQQYLGNWGTGRERQFAEFGELTYHITNALSLTGGPRHYDVSKGPTMRVAMAGLSGLTPPP